jgi:isopentenyl diphosphate isomerase/L-lactate dehydrogenase-like FMN-dependent dehydrogenase
MEPVNVADYERLAEQALPQDVFGYYAGGAEDEQTLRDNLAAWTRWHLRPRVLVDVGGVTTSTTVLGQEVALPILLAPVAYQGLAHPDGERGSARAAAAARTIMCLSTFANTAPAELAEAVPGGAHWFQLYWFRDSGVMRELVQQAVEASFGAVVLTVDAAVPARRERDVRTGFRITPDVPVPSVVAALGNPASGPPGELFSLVTPSVTWRRLEELSEFGLPVVLKGIVTAEDARLACEHGAAALVVSNHGGRQLDGGIPTADALTEVVDAVEGRIEVYVDGGIRRGSQVVKALALGARAVLVGRPFLWGLAVDGAAGVERVLTLLQAELAHALALCGCTSPADVTPAHVTRARL